MHFPSHRTHCHCGKPRSGTLCMIWNCSCPPSQTGICLSSWWLSSGNHRSFSNASCCFLGLYKSLGQSQNCPVPPWFGLTGVAVQFSKQLTGKVSLWAILIWLLHLISSTSYLTHRCDQMYRHLSNHKAHLFIFRHITAVSKLPLVCPAQTDLSLFLQAALASPGSLTSL